MRLVPFKSQQDCISRMVSAIRENGAVLNNSGTGAGKTLQAIEACRELGLHPIVVTTATTTVSWTRAMLQQELDWYDVLSWEKIKNGSTEWYQVRKSGRHAYRNWKAPKDAILIFDESQKCMKLDTQNAKMVLQALSQKIPLMFLSATPFIDPLTMGVYAVAFRLIPSSLQFIRWAKSMGAQKNFWGSYEYKDTPENMARIAALNAALTEKNLLVKADPVEIASHFPENVVHTKLIEVDKKTAAQVNAVAALFVKQEGLREDDIKRAQLKKRDIQAITDMLRARQMVEAMKIPYIVETARNMLDSGNSVVVFVSFTDTIDAIRELFSGTPCCEISGRVTGKKRQEAIDRFQNDEAHLCIVQIASGGAGISLHDTRGVRPRVALLNVTYSFVEMEQALGRIHRLGGKTPAIQYLLVAANTIEETVADQLRKKYKTATTLLNGEEDTTRIQ